MSAMDEDDGGVPTPWRLRLWTLRKDGQTAACDAIQQRLGAEMVVTVTVIDEVRRTEVAVLLRDISECANKWRDAFEADGWTAGAWTLRFGPSPGGLAWVVEREDGAGPTIVCAPNAYEEARQHLVRQALADDVEAVQLVVEVVNGTPGVRREVLDR